MNILKEISELKYILNLLVLFRKYNTLKANYLLMCINGDIILVIHFT